MTPMRICLISVEIFAWGKHGGFGRATRTIGGELARRGHTVFAVVPRRPGQRPVEELDGITVLGFPPLRPWAAIPLLRQCNADVYHSCEPSISTYLAKQAMPDRRHMVTFRDPRDFRDWQMEFALPSLNKLQVLHNYVFENNWLVRRAIHRMDATYTTCKALIPKVQAMYGLARPPVFLPTPVAVPERVEKAARPTVCYMARLDRRKQPERFFELARQFPDVSFIAAGQSRDPGWERRLRATYGSLPNLDLVGFVDQFASPRHSQILAQSWIFVNTATREAMPNAFLEAAAHRCAILSGVDPDDFASAFGYHAARGDFAQGLRTLLAGDTWRARGQRGYVYVKDTFATDRALNLHIAAYEQLLAQPPHAGPLL